jgi:hypothetical protein
MTTFVGPREMPMQISVDIGQVTIGRPARDPAADSMLRSVELNISLSTTGAALLQSAASVPDGQTIVVGTAKPFPDMGALILVVRPRIE